MIQLGSLVKVADKTGVVLGQCIKVLGNSCKRIAYIGDIILISVKWINVKKFHKVKERLKKRFRRGSMHRALIIRVKVNVKVINGVFIKFNENAVIIISKKILPLSNRAHGPVLKNFCIKLPALGCIARTII